MIPVAEKTGIGAGNVGEKQMSHLANNAILSMAIFKEFSLNLQYFQYLTYK